MNVQSRARLWGRESEGGGGRGVGAGVAGGAAGVWAKRRQLTGGTMKRRGGGGEENGDGTKRPARSLHGSRLRSITNTQKHTPAPRPPARTPL